MKKLIILLLLSFFSNFTFSQKLIEPKFEKDNLVINGTFLRVDTYNGKLKGDLFFKSKKTVFNDYKETEIIISSSRIEKLLLGGYLNIDNSLIYETQFVNSSDNKYIKFYLDNNGKTISLILGYNYSFEDIEYINVIYKDDNNKIISITIKNFKK